MSAHIIGFGDLILKSIKIKIMLFGKWMITEKFKKHVRA
jgi:hypothetical protein